MDSRNRFFTSKQQGRTDNYPSTDSGLTHPQLEDPRATRGSRLLSGVSRHLSGSYELRNLVWFVKRCASQRCCIWRLNTRSCTSPSSRASVERRLIQKQSATAAWPAARGHCAQRPWEVSPTGFLFNILKSAVDGEDILKVYNELGGDVEDGRGAVALGQTGQRWTDSAVRQLQRICFVTPGTIFPFSRPSGYDSSLSCNVSKGSVQNIMIDSYCCCIFTAEKKTHTKKKQGWSLATPSTWLASVAAPAYLGQCSVLPRNMRQPLQSASFPQEITCSPLLQCVQNHLQYFFFFEKRNLQNTRNACHSLCIHFLGESNKTECCFINDLVRSHRTDKKASLRRWILSPQIQSKLIWCELNLSRFVSASIS